MDIFDALADPVRRAVLLQLVGGPARVVDLAAPQPISRPAISRHLRKLTDVGLVEAEDLGRERHYSLRTEPLATVDTLLRGLRSADRRAPISHRALDALETEVRRTARESRTRPTEPVPTQRRETA